MPRGRPRSSVVGCTHHVGNHAAGLRRAYPPGPGRTMLSGYERRASSRAGPEPPERDPRARRRRAPGRAAAAPQHQRQDARRRLRWARPLSGRGAGAAADRGGGADPGKRARPDRLRDRLDRDPRGARRAAGRGRPDAQAGDGPAGARRRPGRARPGAAARPDRSRPPAPVLAAGGGRRRRRDHAGGAAAMTEPAEPASPPQPPPAQRGPAAATVLAGALLVLVGVGWLLDANGVDVPWRAVLPAALIAVGLATIPGALRDRQHGRMVLGLALTLALAVGTDWGLQVTLVGGGGERVEQTATPADLRDYRLALGSLTVDLTGLQ